MKEVKVVLDDFSMYHIKRLFIQNIDGKYVCDGDYIKYPVDEELLVSFNVEHGYDVIRILSNYWGGWNNCPDGNVMYSKAKDWYERYDAELSEISHDRLKFKCRKLSEEEVKNIIFEASALSAELVDVDKENQVAYMLEKSEFTMWWD